MSIIKNEFILKKVKFTLMDTILKDDSSPI